MEGLRTGLMDVTLGGGGAGDDDGRRNHRRDGGEDTEDGGEREERSQTSSAEVVASGENDADGRQGYSLPPMPGMPPPMQLRLGMVEMLPFWRRYERHPREQEYSPPVDETRVDTEPTQEELDDLSKACSRLWELDLNRLVPGKDYKIDCTVGTKVYQKEDKEGPSLFEWLGDGVFRRPTFSRFYSLVEHCYHPSLGCRGVVTRGEKHEQAAFIEEISRTAPIKYLYKCLVSKGIISGNYAEFQRMLMGLWFDLYGRGGVPGSSFPFVHVFVGEIKEQAGEGEVSGFHSWIQFYFAERSRRVNYHGFIFQRRRGQDPDSETQQLTVQFDWNGIRKAVLVGVSPEFEIALYTLCFFLGGEDNHVRLGHYSVNIKCYRHGNDRIGSVVPISLD